MIQDSQLFINTSRKRELISNVLIRKKRKQEESLLLLQGSGSHFAGAANKPISTGHHTSSVRSAEGKALIPIKGIVVLTPPLFFP